MAAAAGRTYIDFVPPHSLLEEDDKVVLRVDLSFEDFKKEQLRVQIDKSGGLRISGERRLRAYSNRWRRFSMDFQVPKRCDAGAIRARLEKGGVMLITMPKLLSPAEEPTTVVGGANAGGIDAKDQQQKDHTHTEARQEAAPAAAKADEENKKDAGGDASTERGRDQDEQHVTSNDAGQAASPGRPAYGFAKRRGRMVWAIAALVLALVGAGLYAMYKLMDPSAETTQVGTHIVSPSDN